MKGAIKLNCLITNGKQYIRLDENGTPMTCGQALAGKFTEDKAKNIIRNLPKPMRKFHFNVQLIPEINSPTPQKVEEPLPEDIDEVLQELDDFYSDYKKSSKNDNPYTYHGETTLEKESSVNYIDIGNFMKMIVNCISELGNYIDNMRYLEKECDLKILDIRHYLRDEETKLGTVSMSRMGYLLQHYERQRAAYKRNRNCARIFQHGIERFKNKKYTLVVDEILNSKYRYRRLSKSYLDDYAKGKTKVKK